MFQSYPHFAPLSPLTATGCFYQMIGTCFGTLELLTLNQENDDVGQTVQDIDRLSARTPFGETEAGRDVVDSAQGATA